MKNIILILMLMLIAGNLTAQGLTKYGEITNTSSNFVDKNGKVQSTQALNANGEVRTGPAVGDSYGGGIVAYILQVGDPGYDANITKGLIAATEDQSTGIIWALSDYQSTSVGTTGSAIGTGSANTDLIVAQNGTGSTYAAGLARAYAGGGYSDWYLPSFNELHKLFENEVAIGGLDRKEFWSSSENSATTAFYMESTYGGSGNHYKYTQFHVRAVRSFAIGALTSIASISGTPNVGSELTAGALSPTGASATYQWTICSTVGGTYTNISGATTNKYTPVEADLGKFIKVVATGSAGCTGTVTSAATSSVSLSIGYSYGGGKVAYIFQYGDPGYDANITKGLIVAASDQSTGISWITGGQTTSQSNGNTKATIGTGQANTNFMKAQTGYEGGAAQVCDDYVNDGYTDWYLPSSDELAKLYDNRVAIGGWTGSEYWSSTEINEEDASSFNFLDGSATTTAKRVTRSVRGVRSFAILPSVTISTQTWSGKNLDVSTYKDGITIRYAGTKADWEDAAADKEGAWCYYGDAEGNNAIYGKLYNWYAVNNSRGLAPAGWHVPSDADWTTLRYFLGGESLAGGKLKEAGTSHWQPTNDGATNESGFTALPGGYRFDDGAFNYIESDGFWWSSTENHTSYAWGRYLNFYNSLLSGNSYGKGYGFSVRCVRDIALTAIAGITGTPNVGSVLTAGALTPTGATATYQWTICSTVDGAYANIYNATSSTYTPVEADLGRFIKVVATGSNGFTGTVTSAATSSISLTIGYSYGGGKVAYILQSGDPGYDANVTQGLIAANSDQSTGASAAWGCEGTALSGADGLAIGTGLQNTIDIMAAPGGCATAGIAARLCRGVTINGYSDWYLPSIDELAKLYLNRVAIDGFASNWYWSSSEEQDKTQSAWIFGFDDGLVHRTNKTMPHYVRAVRSFVKGALSSIAAVIGTPNVGSVLTAGALTPIGATATYQWTICSTVDGNYENISDATSNTYTPVIGDVNKFIKVVATGSGDCTGTQTSTATAAVSLSIGYSYGGGKVAYILQPDDPGYAAGVTKGLIAANSDQGMNNTPWGCEGTLISGADGSEIGTGLQNTIDIMAAPGGCATAGIAARLCGGVEINGYSDWYLPSIDELAKLYLNRVAISGFSTAWYWSSSEETEVSAWVFGFDDGKAYYTNKSMGHPVRAVRSFALGGDD